ncbi:MAG TPA: flagellar basal body P-ring formation chaperone FlgA [Devosia sp.]|nr:flagellar basal body P-ring formation chaperone FlgA [Devosia sp.]
MKTLTLAALLALLATSAEAAPSLRGDITVNNAIVTVGDMFDDAGPLAETALFRAPAPGTTGIVALEDVQRAALSIGLGAFENIGYTRVRVARAATIVDAATLGDLVTQDLIQRGVIVGDIKGEVRFDVADLAINAEAIDTPARLVSLRYQPNGAFAARFLVAGIDRPIDLTGGVQLLVPAPRLTANRPAGAILTPDDFETAMVPLAAADAGSYATIDQLVGQQLLRQSRAGMMLKASDVGPPTVVSRNAAVTVFFRLGAMTLTVQGKALGSAALGQPVDVLNTVTKKILHGIARADGGVDIPSSTTTAGL